MVKSDVQTGRTNSASHFVRGVCRATFFLGNALRRTVDLALFPYRTMSNRVLRRRNDVTGARKTRLAGSDGAEIPEALLDALSDPDPAVRSSSLGAIGGFSKEETTLVVLEALHDPEPTVRCAAAAAAARTRASSTVFSLILLLDDPSLEVKRAAEVAIEKITDHKFSLDPTKSASVRRKKIDTLKSWWKKERFARLAAEIETVVKS